MPAKLAQHPLMFAAMLFAAATGAMGFAAIPKDAPTLAYDLSPQVAADDHVSDDSISKVLEKESPAITAKMDQDLECMAKVVLHEARNQPRSGQLAVAQLIMNRVGNSRFGNSVCAVVNQRGQFFRTASYNPRRDSADWMKAVEVARQAMAGDGDQVVPGAVYFHAAHHAPNRFFRSRERISMVGDHIFYR